MAGLAVAQSMRKVNYIFGNLSPNLNMSRMKLTF